MRNVLGLHCLVRYRLRVHEGGGPSRAALRGVATLDLFVRPDSDSDQRELVLTRWYREQLKLLAAPLLAKWQPILDVQLAAWGVKKMKTKWGSCNPISRRVWLNLELAKKPVVCLEYIIVHELAHLIERNHTDRFLALMDRYLPNWRGCRRLLNSGVLGHEVWDY